MSKQSVIDTINDNITTNGQKSISAHVLNNVLTEIVNNSGEGGGALRIMVPDSEMFAPYFYEYGSFSLETFRTIVSVSPDFSSMGDLVSKYEDAITEMMAYNSEMYNTLKSKALNNEGTIVLLDSSKPFSIVYSTIMGSEMVGFKSCGVSTAVPAQCMALYADVENAPEEIPTENVTLHPISTDAYINGIYVKGLIITLNPDGSFIFDGVPGEKYSLFVSETDFTDDSNLTENLKTLEYLGYQADSSIKNVTIYNYSGSISNKNPQISPTESYFGNSEAFIRYFDGKVLKEASFNTGTGAVTVTIIE